MTPELLAHLTPEQQTLQLDRYELEPPAGDIIGDLLLELAQAKQALAAAQARDTRCCCDSDVAEWICKSCWTSRVPKC